MRLYDGGNTNPDSKISKTLNFDMESFQFYGSYNFGDVYIFMGKTVVFFFSKFHFLFSHAVLFASVFEQVSSLIASHSNTLLMSYLCLFMIWLLNSQYWYVFAHTHTRTHKSLPEPECYSIIKMRNRTATMTIDYKVCAELNILWRGREKGIERDRDGERFIWEFRRNDRVVGAIINQLVQ